jgi:hypothetical protein
VRADEGGGAQRREALSDGDRDRPVHRKGTTSFQHTSIRNSLHVLRIAGGLG